MWSQVGYHIVGFVTLFTLSHCWFLFYKFTLIYISVFVFLFCPFQSSQNRSCMFISTPRFLCGMQLCSSWKKACSAYSSLHVLYTVGSDQHGAESHALNANGWTEALCLSTSALLWHCSHICTELSKVWACPSLKEGSGEGQTFT